MDKQSLRAAPWDGWVYFQKFFHPPGRCQIRSWKKKKAEKKQRDSEVKEEIEKTEIGPEQEIVHQGPLCTLLGRYLNLSVYDAVLPFLISFLSSLSTEKSPRKNHLLFFFDVKSLMLFRGLSLHIGIEIPELSDRCYSSGVVTGRLMQKLSCGYESELECSVITCVITVVY